MSNGVTQIIWHKVLSWRPRDKSGSITTREPVTRDCCVHINIIILLWFFKPDAVEEAPPHTALRWLYKCAVEKTKTHPINVSHCISRIRRDSFLSFARLFLVLILYYACTYANNCNYSKRRLTVVRIAWFMARTGAIPVPHIILWPVLYLL